MSDHPAQTVRCDDPRTYYTYGNLLVDVSNSGVTSNDELPPKRGKARWLYETLLRQIEHGAWPHGYRLPSEDDLEFKHPREWLYGLPPSEAPSEKKPNEEPRSYFSRTTIRNALTALAEIGRVITYPGKYSIAYMPGMEPHRLVVDLPRRSSTELAMVAEPRPAIEFIPATGSAVSVQWHEGEGEYEVPEWDSQRLGIDTGTKLRTYTLTLLIGGVLTLISASFVPSDLLSGTVTWEQKPVGELALTGISAAFSRPTMHGRVPTLDEAKPLKSPKPPKPRPRRRTRPGVPVLDESNPLKLPESLEPLRGIPVFAVYRQCLVTPLAVRAIQRRACVVVTVRTDLVHL